jgi:hypothetical protein
MPVTNGASAFIMSYFVVAAMPMPRPTKRTARVLPRTQPEVASSESLLGQLRLKPYEFQRH